MYSASALSSIRICGNPQTNRREPHYFLDSMGAQAYNYSIMNRLSLEKRAQVVNALVEGVSIRAACRLTGVCKDPLFFGAPTYRPAAARASNSLPWMPPK